MVDFHDRRDGQMKRIPDNGPKSVESGLPLHEELKQAGFLEGEDAENYAMHYGATPDGHVQRGRMGVEIAYCDAPHAEETECDRCGWEGKIGAAPFRGYQHRCPNCDNDVY